MNSRLLCRIVFGSYFAVFALALVLHALVCCAKKQMGLGLLWMLPAGLCTVAAICAYSRLEALRQIGINALPTLVDLLSARDSGPRRGLMNHKQSQILAREF